MSTIPIPDEPLVESLLNNICMPIAYMDIDFNFIKVNNAYASTDENNAEHFIGKNHFVLFPNVENESIFREVVKTGKPYHAYAKPFQYKKNPERGVSHWDWTLTPVNNATGEISGVILLLIDVSKHVDNEIALTNEQQFVNSIMDAAGDLIIVLDATGRIIKFNAAAEKLTGYTFGEAEGRYVWDFLLLPEEADKVKNVFLSLASDNHNEFQNYWVAKDGGKHFIHWNNTVLAGPTGNMEHTVSIGQDITEKRKNEKELETYRQHLENLVAERTAELLTAKDQADRANNEKSKFLSRMSHELRTPLNAILGFGQLLEMDTDDLNDAQREHVKDIMDSGHHLLNLINEVLDLAKIESGKVSLSLEETNINELSQNCIVLIHNQAEERQIEVINHLEAMEYCVLADHTRLKEVLLNLLSNAVKYNRDQGRITLDGKVIDNQRLRVSVSDTGEGLSNDEIDKLFIPFERLVPSTIEGTGMGLVITKFLIELMGGTIGIDSTKGKGSSFWFELPLSGQT